MNTVPFDSSRGTWPREPRVVEHLGRECVWFSRSTRATTISSSRSRRDFGGWGIQGRFPEAAGLTFGAV